MRTVSRRLMTAVCLLAIPAMLAVAVRAENFPARPVRIITDSAPGSALDAIMRVIAEGLSRVWGQQAVMINQPSPD